MRSRKPGRPNGYILGEGAGGAFVAGLRYGEGMLYTKNAGEHKVFWQGPSIGYDFGAEGSKTMILVYNLQRVEDIYATFGGVDGSAYFIARRRHYLPDAQACDSRSDPLGRRLAARRQCRLSEIYPAAHMEPILKRDEEKHVPVKTGMGSGFPPASRSN